MKGANKATGILAGSLILGLVSLYTMTSSNIQSGYAGGFASSGSREEGFTFGTIASLQNDINRNPAWILSGRWNTSLVHELLSAQANASYSGPSFFNASFEMVKTDGSARHIHTITNFGERESSASNNNMTLLFNGTATVSMEEGPIENVSANLTILNDNIISIWLDPRKTGNHFGDTPIFGIAMKKK